MNGADWSKRYPPDYPRRIAGLRDYRSCLAWRQRCGGLEALHSRYNNGRASVCVVICLCSMVTAFGRNRLPNARPCCVKYWAALTQKQYKPGRLVLCFVHRLTSYMNRIVVLVG